MADKARVEQVSVELDRFLQQRDAKLEALKNEVAEPQRLIEQGKANILELKAEQRELELQQRNRNRKWSGSLPSGGEYSFQLVTTIWPTK